MPTKTNPRSVQILFDESSSDEEEIKIAYTSDDIVKRQLPPLSRIITHNESVKPTTSVVKATTSVVKATTSVVEFGPPDSDLNLCLRKPYTLFPHQVDAIRWMKNIEANPRLNMSGGIIALMPGLGKTLVYSGLCMTERDNEYPNLVVCSKTVAYSWKQEINKFFGDTCPYFYLHKSDLKKQFDLLSYDVIKKYKIIITTYETVMAVATKHKVTDRLFAMDQHNRRCGIKPCARPDSTRLSSVRGGMLLFSIPWNRITLDESHRIANPMSTTFHSMMALWGSNKWNLSGTPLRNYSSDLYSQFRFNGYDKNIIARQFNYTEYERNRMIDFTLYRTYEDAGIVLPPVVRKNIVIKLDGREREIYEYYLITTKQAYNGFLIGTINFSSILVLFLRMRQLCISPYTILAESSRGYVTDDDQEYSLSQQILDKMTSGLATWIGDKYGTAGVESQKMRALVDILKSFESGEKTLVFTNFKKVIDIASLAVRKYMPHVKFLVLDGDVTGDAREAAINNFKDLSKNYTVMFISYKVGSEGLTLVEAQNVIHMENWWTPVVQQQAERRVWRIGQTRPVKIFNITIADSIEERIEGVCKEKTAMIDSFLTSGHRPGATKLDASMIGRLIR